MSRLARAGQPAGEGEGRSQAATRAAGLEALLSPSLPPFPGSRPARSRLLTPIHPQPGPSRNVEVGRKGLGPLPSKHTPISSPVSASVGHLAVKGTRDRDSITQVEVGVLLPP